MARSLRILRPCPRLWDDLSPASGGRHCATCDRVVIDASRLSRTELEELVATGESVCARVPTLPDGSLLTRDDPRLRHRSSGFSAAFTAALAASAIACAPGAEPEPSTAVAGDVTSEVPTESRLELTDEQIEMLSLLGALGYVDE